MSTFTSCCWLDRNVEVKYIVPSESAFHPSQIQGIGRENKDGFWCLLMSFFKQKFEENKGWKLKKLSYISNPLPIPLIWGGQMI